MRAIDRLVRFMGSLAGRIAVILSVGISLAMFGALLLAEQGRRAEYDRLRSERVIASAVDVIDRLHRDRAGTLASLRDNRLVGARLVDGPPIPATVQDDALTRMLALRIAPGMRPTVGRAPASVCLRNDPFWGRPRAAGFAPLMVPDCWLVRFRLDGRPLALAVALPRLPLPPSWSTDTVFLWLVAAAAIALSLLVAALATSPLRRLSAAADAFAGSIDAEPVLETGPSDVRAALATFNLMQERVRAGLRERTRMLAAISHDLQTPLTRLRLRLEQVEDEVLRDRLVADLSATLAMLKRGLDLARSADSVEDWSMVDLDSLLSSLADDAAEFGHAVRFVDGCGALVRVRPDALTRCLSNLIDNAIKYGGDADIASRRVGKTVIVTVRDHGPGMSDAMLACAFDPFVRADVSRSSGDGTGIGLTIARAQATATGATLSLAAHPDGGIQATLTLGAT
ncbi:ATP-binding protein [Sphingomonas prati]|uniref:histidine kinase n=1 Tax=Sphingomonas prati TaxID=1843237 RepID=A0A7W9BUM1_9SPHN|nr:ATP-binding protein [Sphingomonas prati]MBB5730331.1 signal transduction histidine kinase [Sphingomonas prati]